MWQRVNGGELDLNRTIGINSSRLNISNIVPNDSGTYICVASNMDEKAESRKAFLYVKGLHVYVDIIT